MPHEQTRRNRAKDATEVGTNLFPTKFPVGSASHGTMHCFIVPQSEKLGNRNY